MDFNTVFGAHQATPIRAPYPYVANQYFESFKAMNDFEDNANGHFAFWVTYALAQQQNFSIRTGMVALPAAAQGQAQVQANNVTGVGVAFRRTAGAIYTLNNAAYTSVQEGVDAFNAGTIPSEDLLMIQRFFDSRAPIVGFLRDLVLCHQTSKLNSENINNYFRMRETSGIQSRTVLAILNAVSHEFNALAPGMAAEIQNNLYLKYHTTKASAPALLTKMIGDLGPYADNFFSAADRTAITNAYRAPWDQALIQAIPQACITNCAAWLDANNAFPDGWFQGAKARDEAGAGKYSASVKLMKMFANALFTARGADKFKHPTAILANFPVSIRRGDPVAPADVTTAITDVTDMKALIDAERLRIMNDARTAAGQAVLATLPIANQATFEEAYLALENR